MRNDETIKRIIYDVPVRNGDKIIGKKPSKPRFEEAKFPTIICGMTSKYAWICHRPQGHKGLHECSLSSGVVALWETYSKKKALSIAKKKGYLSDNGVILLKRKRLSA